MDHTPLPGVDISAHLVALPDQSVNYNPLRTLLERIDFDGCAGIPGGARLHQRDERSTGLRLVRERGSLGDVRLASAALPQVYQAVEIDGEQYWDGGYTAIRRWRRSTSVRKRAT